ncbi:uncharacterized protein LOC108906248 [Anoplophora glabripennis]|uniref:uncharacterized protein LOC108906248 n=1 Tax=Anoplophora glabripennis TaxID=217634 RepID=UPI000874C3CE|nr:uncharacterized protein LOC108906248 [Anoplophora glabripennis]
MTDTRYDNCAGIIEVTPASSSTDCVSGYCAFVRCIRRVNSDLLIARCYTEASADNPADLEEEQIILYKNITSCILAISRCSAINPITGQSQTNTITSTTYGKLGLPMTTTVPLYNTLQINEAGDLRIVTFPGTTTIQKYLCPYEFNLRETSWMDFMC